MIIAITPEDTLPNEHVLIKQLLEGGLDLLHIRKKQLDEKAIQDYIETIPKTYWKQLVLHRHYHLASEFGIQRLHFSEKDRRKRCYLPYQNDYSLSTSVHSIGDFNTLAPYWAYAFLSPVFPSISKTGYGVSNAVLHQLKLKNNPYVRLIGLGGVSESNYHLLKNEGADGGALLGSIWKKRHPLKTFIACKEIDQSY